jgi:hypothetical protein
MKKLYHLHNLGYRRGYYQVSTESYRTEQVQDQLEHVDSGLYSPVTWESNLNFVQIVENLLILKLEKKEI